jgi:hypothetical protein
MLTHLKPTSRTLPVLLLPVRANPGAAPVTGGIPLPPGWLMPEQPVSLRRTDGGPLPLQARPLGFWPDGSVRWILLDTRCPSTADGRPIHCMLERTARAPDLMPPAPSPPRCTCEAGMPVVGACSLQMELTDHDGAVCSALVRSVTEEVIGPLRSTTCLRGEFVRPGGERVFQFRLRVATHAGDPRIRVEPMIVVDSDTGILHSIRQLRLICRHAAATRGACRVGIGGLPRTARRAMQLDDLQYSQDGGPPRKGRLDGWARAEGLTLALAETWQQWPKAFEPVSGGLACGLFPAFVSGTFDHMEPWYKHQYLFEDDCYRLRVGQARSWTIWIDPQGGDGPALAALANQPPLITAEPGAAADTGAWGGIAAAGPRLARYDAWAHRWFEAYRASIAIQRDYGAMNWGDWFGERQVNWGNHEYDTVNQLLIQYARTADPAYFQVAATAARHSAEVDVVHAVNPELADYFNTNWRHEGFEPRPGMVHEHCIGHVGAFYPVETIRQLFIDHSADPANREQRPYLCLDPFNLGHIWTQGLVRHHFLTGDPFARETVESIGDNLARLTEDGYRFSCDDPHFGRTAGWSLLALAGAYEIAQQPRYLAAMRYLVDLTLSLQDPVCGGWLYNLYPGHCYCTTRKHVGMAGFIVSILINGLSRFYDLTRDARIPPAVERGVTFLNNDTWVEHRRGWRYTSCPASAFAGRMGVTLLALANSVRLTNNTEHRRILALAWRSAFDDQERMDPGPGQGKSYTAAVYGCAETVAVLARRNRFNADKVQPVGAARAPR